MGGIAQVVAWVMLGGVLCGCGSSSRSDASTGADSGGSDGAVAPPDATGLDGGITCERHHDCPQTEFCHHGTCRRDDLPVYHCGEPGCPPGFWCIDEEGRRSTCPEDLDHPCVSACDCGPAHCCIDLDGDPTTPKACVRDDGDPWASGEPTATAVSCRVGPDVADAERTPTYCATALECFAAQSAWNQSGRQGTFRAWDPVSEEVVGSCGTRRCFGTSCNCPSGDVCLDTISEVAAPGRVCGLLSGGSCVASALAESVFGAGPDDLLACCTEAIQPGERCDLGWKRSGNRFAYERVVAEVPVDGACTCGDGICCPTEAEDCPFDCVGAECGNGRCDPFEDGERCPGDCDAGCGDGQCEAPETAATCEPDCSERCGDGWCSPAEVATGGCVEDCASRCSDAALYTRVHRICGDGRCDRRSTCDWLEPESCETCPQDCGACDWEVMYRASDEGVVLTPTVDAIWTSGPDDVYVAADGALAHFDGLGWRAVRVREPIASVWGTGPDDVFAVGRGGVIVHHDGATWSRMASRTDEDLTTVWGTGSDHVFAAGRSGVVLHYRMRESWQRVATPWLGNVVALWGTGPADLFAIVVRPSGTGRDVWRFDGSNWREFEPPPLRPTAPPPDSFTDGWASSPDDVYVVAADDGIYHHDGTDWTVDRPEPGGYRGVYGAAADDVFVTVSPKIDGMAHVLRFDGTAWWSDASVPSLDLVVAPWWSLSGVWGSGADNVYVAVENLGLGRVLLLRYDGSSWSTVEILGERRGFSDLWASTSERVFASSARGYVASYEGGVVTRTPFDNPCADLLLAGQRLEVRSIWGAGPDALWAGASGTCSVVRQHTIQVFGDGSWTTPAAPTASCCSGCVGDPCASLPGYVRAWGRSRSDLYVAGFGLWHFDGRWSQVAHGQPLEPAGVWGTDSVLFVSGWMGGLARRDSGGWQYLGGGGTRLAGLWGSAADDVFAVGERATLHYDGSSVTVTGHGFRLNDVHGLGADDVYAAGDAGVLLHYDGVDWQPAQVDTRDETTLSCPDLTGIEAVDGTFVVAGDPELLLVHRP